MNHRPSPNLLAFAAVGCLIVAARFAPVTDATSVAKTYGWIGAGMFGMFASMLAIQAITQSEHRPSPFPSPFGRIAWVFLRPRGFIVAWALIIGVAHTIGLPALAVEYPPRPCTYLTWDGLARSSRPSCPWWILVKPGDRP